MNNTNTELNSSNDEINSNPKKERKNKSFDIKRLVGMATFAALAYVVGIVTGIVKVSFLSFDAKDAIITLAAFVYGPLSAVAISLVTALIESVSFSGTGIYGFIMDFASSACFSALAGLVYKFRRTGNGAIISFGVASVGMVSLMMLLNCFVTPLYITTAATFAENQAVVLSMIPTLILPFNIAKALLNSAIAMLLYKPITLALRRTGLMAGEAKMTFNRKTAVITTIAIAALAAGIVLLVVLNAALDFSTLWKA